MINGSMVPEILAISIVILLFSVIVHEVMHGLMALRFGDHTAQKAGRLTLNPIPHIDPIGTILLPGLLILSGAGIIFGWAKPVPVNPLNFTNLRRGELAVSAAGIGANITLAIIAAVIFHLLNNFYPNFLLIQLASFTVNINLLLAVFNLLPIPPLDGSKVLLSQLPYHLAKEYQRLEAYGLILIAILWFIPFGGDSLLFFILKWAISLLKTLLFIP